MLTVALAAITAWTDIPRFQPSFLYLGTLYIDFYLISSMITSWAKPWSLL